MFEYPSIQGPTKAPRKPCIAFEKLDGSNLRWEWRPKKGWVKQGTRKALFDESDQIFGPAIPAFRAKYAEALDDIFRREKQFRNVRSIVAFTEYLGPSSFAGVHDITKDRGKMTVVLFDVWVEGEGILGPSEFIKTFCHLPTPKTIYAGNFNESLIAHCPGRSPWNRRRSRLQGRKGSGRLDGQDQDPGIPGQVEGSLRPGLGSFWRIGI